ncbi:terminal uridylyltransferase Tailor [Anabrus simplex]|uniref:terminal uridylyltransferase Tailor n=1 Tax=Anabrus simplex TaxID=316456 RepID=UPI0035A2B674
MEVRGSVIVGDITDPQFRNKKRSSWAHQRLVYHNGVPTMQLAMDEAHGKNQLPTSDDIPRIAVKGFRKSAKLWSLFSLFNKFGTVTYVGVSEQFAVVEFEDRNVVEKILPLTHLRHEDSVIKVEPLSYFPHAVPEQMEFYLQDEITSAFASTRSLENYIDDLCMGARLESNPERDLAVCRVLETSLQSLYPDCKAHPFGSRVSGLGLPHCDLDVFCDTGDMYDGNSEQDPLSQEILVTSTCKILSKDKDFNHLHAVPKARVPILRFLHVPSTTFCDVAFRHGMGVENTKLLVFLLSLDPRLHPLCIFVKKWAHLQEFRAAHKMGHFSSYALVMMVVFFFQQLPEPILPPIYLLQAKHTGPRHYIAGWDCTFTTDKSKVPATSNTQTVLELLEEFCKFYRSFDYDNFVICPLLGSRIEKTDFQGSMTNLQPFMSRYRQLISDGEATKFPVKCPISVQDPLDLSHNLTRPVKYDHLMKFISTCGLTQSLCGKLH